MANKKMKWFSIATLACAASLCVGFGAANVTADAAETKDGFAITATSVRLDDPTKEGVDSGLRFKVDVPEGVKVENAFTVVSFTSSVKTEENPNGDPKAYSTTIPATVYRADGGWNAVLLDIPASDYKTEVTAQAFATINGVEYKTAEKTSSINAAATAAFNAGLATYSEVGQYMDWETATESVTFKDTALAVNAVEFTSYELENVTITGNKGSNSNPPKYYTASEAVRVYGGNKLTITANEGYIITTVKLVAGTAFTNGASVSKGSFDNGMITDVNDEEVTFTYGGASGNVPIKGVEVTYKSLALGWEDRKAAVEEELEGLFAETYAKDAVLELPASIKGVALTWDSDNAAIAIANGKATITRPANAPATVTVTVNGEHADGTLEKTYEITVAQISDQEKVDAEIAAIDFDKASVKTLEDTVTLPNKTTKYNDVTITWDIVSGNDANHLFLNGNVLTVKSLPTGENVMVKVQATATLNDATATTETYNVEVVAQGGQATAKEKTITFNLGANGSGHKDGSSANSYNETVDGVKLSITNGSKMYTAACDSTGNSCIKFGANSGTGSCQFTVPDNVTKVILYVAKYKTDAAKIKVNDTAYTLSKSSNDGAYDTIEVDTSENKTVKFETTSKRAMLGQIDFIVLE